ncbi:MAG: YdcF family protein [Mycobacteriaceae bacterium]
MTRQRTGFRRWTVRLVLGAVLMALVLVGGTAIRVWQVARDDNRASADAMLVLGAAQYDGTPSSVFAARLEHARALYEEGVAPRVITVGGKQPGDEYTEAASGREYLINEGVPASAIIAIEEGSDTLLSIKAVAQKMDSLGLSSVVLVSDPWHSLRTRAMADDQGLDARTSPTHQGPAVTTRASQAHGIFRETGALMYYRLTHATTAFSDTSSARG